MKTHSIAVTIAITFGLGTFAPGCSIISTRHDYDPGFDFSGLKTSSDQGNVPWSMTDM